ncbi:hypothetical protein [Bradyrhizobium sp. SZCCHNRI2049]|uniref:hypothetical protein n=1 Tax=Bradyrhizobium sp. SZCCHNRI2049 TaxID=3057287 RepID=UPI002916A58C|nr:hypothetical protein [Bradyrhizobium sp. SZCCHNRI2049]
MIELPPAVARAFVEAMRAYFAEDDPAKRGQIAVLQMHALRDHWKGKLRLHDVEAMFIEMREHLRPADQSSSQAPKRQRPQAAIKTTASTASRSNRRS